MNIFLKIAIIICLEIAVTVLFTFITPKTKKDRFIDIKSILKGLLERAFLTYSLYCNLPHALTLFGALKLGTRLKMPDNDTTEEGRKKVSIFNDYYLVGNLISVTLSIIYYNLIQ